MREMVPLLRRLHFSGMLHERCASLVRYMICGWTSRTLLLLRSYFRDSEGLTVSMSIGLDSSPDTPLNVRRPLNKTLDAPFRREIAK